MKKWGWMTAAVLTAVLTAAQPAMAEMSDVIVIPEGPVIEENTGEYAAAEAAPAPEGSAVVPEDPAETEAEPETEAPLLSPVIVAGQSGKQEQQESGTENPDTQQETEGAEAQTGEEGTDVQTGEETGQEEQTSGRQLDLSRPMVALTFDDGPQTSVGTRIMDCLAQYDGRATFFLVGDRVNAHAAEVQRMVAEGHEVANHTLNHKYLQKLGAAEIQAQVNGCNDVIEAVSGVRPTLMRLPGGNYNATVLANTGMPMIQWNIDTLDWKTRNADSTVQAVLAGVSDGDIVLMHELYSQTGDAALRIIPELAARGFQMVTVSEMAAAKGYAPAAGQLYSSFK